MVKIAADMSDPKATPKPMLPPHNAGKARCYAVFLVFRGNKGNINQCYQCYLHIMPENRYIMRFSLLLEVTKVTLGNIANVTAQTRYNTAFEGHGNTVTLKLIKRVTEKK